MRAAPAGLKALHLTLLLALAAPAGSSAEPDGGAGGATLRGRLRPLELAKSCTLELRRGRTDERGIVLPIDAQGRYEARELAPGEVLVSCANSEGVARKAVVIPKAGSVTLNFDLDKEFDYAFPEDDPRLAKKKKPR